MGIYKRGRVWYFDFIRQGIRHQGSTGQTNKTKAADTEARLKSEAAFERFGIAKPKASPLFKDFAERFLSHVRQHARKPRTTEFYEARIARLIDYFGEFRLSAINEDLISKYKVERAAMRRRLRGGPRKTGALATPNVTPSENVVQASSMSTDAHIGPWTINAELRTLRRALGLAHEWQLIQRLPKVRQLPATPGRTFVLTGEMEVAYLAAIHYPLLQAAVLMLDLGLRPEECISLRKPDIEMPATAFETVSARHRPTMVNLQVPAHANFVLIVRSGKTANAARSLPLTDRAREAIEFLCAVHPDSEWLFPGRKTGTHMTRANLDHLHEAVREANGWPAEFVIYSARHTYGTRLAESGASNFEIMRLMGHAKVETSSKYIHLSADHLTLAAKRAEQYAKVLRGEVHSETPEKSRTS